MKGKLVDNTDGTSMGLIDDHKRAVLMTGNLSDFQINNLKNWMIMLFPSEKVDRYGLSYDFSNSNFSNSDAMGDAGKINLSIHLKPNVPKKEFKDSIKTYKEWCKFLFWEGTKVKVSLYVGK
jgi:hypothetical protein